MTTVLSLQRLPLTRPTSATVDSVDSIDCSVVSWVCVRPGDAAGEGA